MDSLAAAPSKRVYMGNLPFHAQKADLEKYLDEAGFHVERLDIKSDPFTGKNPSYCFVELSSIEEAQRAISELPGASFMGRTLKVNVHIPRRQEGSYPQDGERTQRPSYGERSDSNRGESRAWRGPGTPARESSNGTAGSPVPAFAAPSSHDGKRVYVGGLPEFADDAALDAEMRSVFGEFNVEQVSKLIAAQPREDAPGLHHYCFVDFASAEDSNAAIAALNGVATSWNGTLRVSLARDRNARQGQTPRRQNYSSSSPAANGGEAPSRNLAGSWRRAN